MPAASAYVIALASVVIVSDDELNAYPTFLERIYGPNHHLSPPPIPPLSHHPRPPASSALGLLVLGFPFLLPHRV